MLKPCSLLIGLFLLVACEASWARDAQRPNILFVIYDDLSAMHTGPYGDKAVKTPAMDRIAREGVRFSRAFTASPSCTPSRSAILTGQAIWRLEEAGMLMGTFPPHLKVYPWLLHDAGYHIGFTGKGWEPGDWKAYGRTTNPTGIEYNEHQTDRGQKLGPDKPLPPVFCQDYAENFQEFLKAKPTDQPFAFWCGFIEPHLPWVRGAGLRQGKRLSDARLPESLPDHPVVREDILDYYTEIEYAESHLVRILDALEKANELDNTLIIVTSDHGHPLPRAKCTVYDDGTHVPLVVRFPRWIKPGRVVDDIVSLTDVAPTLLEAAGLPVPGEMTGRSWVPLLESEESGWLDPTRDSAYIAFERHTFTRPENKAYGVRALRTDKFLYIRNMTPDRWPVGDPDFKSVHQGHFGDIDGSPTKQFLLNNRDTPELEPYFKLATDRRPAEELYALEEDAAQMVNIATHPRFAEVKLRLRQRMDKDLADTGDPRYHGQAPWDDYPYFYKDLWKSAKGLKIKPE